MSRRGGFFSSGNPVMNERAYQKASNNVLDADMVGTQIKGETMTVSGAVNKSFILMGLLLAFALVGYVFPSSMFIMGGGLLGLGIVLLAVFKTHWSPVLAPIYAIVEGLFVGAVSAMYAAAFDGIIFQAVSLTMAVLFLMLFLYKMEIIKVTQKLRSGVIMATGAVFIVYILSFVLSFFGITVPYIHEGGMIGIGISVVIVGIASMNLLLDFDNFEVGERLRSPKYMEWFSAMGLIITLVWLYIEILRLLSKLRD